MRGEIGEGSGVGKAGREGTGERRRGVTEWGEWDGGWGGREREGGEGRGG